MELPFYDLAGFNTTYANLVVVRPAEGVSTNQLAPSLKKAVKLIREHNPKFPFVALIPHGAQLEVLDSATLRSLGLRRIQPDLADYQLKFDQVRHENNALRQQARSVPDLEAKVSKLEKQVREVQYGIVGASSPGEVFADVMESSQPLYEGWSRVDCMRALGMEVKEFFSFLEGHVIVDVPLALKLGEKCGNGPRIWLALQHQYNLSKLREITDAANDDPLMTGFCHAGPCGDGSAP